MTYTRIKKGVTVWYELHKPRSATYPTIVFIHGWVQNHTGWKKIAHDLHAKGYGTLIFDLPGHGLSSTPQQITEFELPTLARTCAALIKRLQLSQIVIVGHSMGGMITQYLYRHIKPSAVILADTTYTSPMADLEAHMSAHLPIVAALISALAHRIKVRNRPQMIDLTKRYNQQELILWIHGASATNARALLACLHAVITVNCAQELRKITCPTLLLVGKNDTHTPPKRMREMRRFVPHAKFVLIPHAGHSINLAAPQACVDAIHSFLESVQTKMGSKKK